MNSPESLKFPSGISKFGLSSPIHRAVFLFLCLLLAGAYTYRALRSYVASRYARRLDLDALQYATRLDPGNAVYANRLGRFLRFAQQDIPSSLKPYRQAVRLNPHEAQYWLDLANVYQFTGNKQEQGRALEQAVLVDPRTPATAWEAGNFFLLQGETQKAMRQFRVVIENDPEQADAALSLCWRVTHDVVPILNEAVPRQPDAYLRLLRLLVTNDQAEAAKKVWISLVDLGQPVGPKGAFPFFEYSLSRRDVDEASKIWSDLLRTDRQLQSYAVPDDLMVNGGFEETILNGGFDWHYQPSKSANMSIDTATVHSGLRSLALDFNGDRQEPGIFQLVPVQPDTEYQFDAYMKGEMLDGANGPRFAVSDVFDKTSYVLTNDLLGSTPWQHATAGFKTNKNARLLAIRLVQVPADTHLRGRLWIDDVSLKKK